MHTEVLESQHWIILFQSWELWRIFEGFHRISSGNCIKLPWSEILTTLAVKSKCSENVLKISIVSSVARNKLNIQSAYCVLSILPNAFTFVFPFNPLVNPGEVNITLPTFRMMKEAEISYHFIYFPYSVYLLPLGGTGGVVSQTQAKLSGTTCLENWNKWGLLWKKSDCRQPQILVHSSSNFSMSVRTLKIHSYIKAMKTLPNSYIQLFQNSIKYPEACDNLSSISPRKSLNHGKNSKTYKVLTDSCFLLASQ